MAGNNGTKLVWILVAAVLAGGTGGGVGYSVRARNGCTDGAELQRHDERIRACEVDIVRNETRYEAILKELVQIQVKLDKLVER